MISIIIVNYKQVAVTKELLESLKNLCIYPNYEIIIVDNDAAYDNELQFKSVINEIVYKPINWNSGFAYANNIGAKIAKGDLLFFLNNDTTITPGILISLEKTLNQNEKAGIVCPIIKYFNEPDKIQYAGYTKIDPFTGRNRIIRVPENEKTYQTEYAHGAAMLMKKSLYEYVGGLDESYFLYYEELDLSSKVKKLGYCIYVDPNAIIYHKVSSSTGIDSPLKNYYLTRNRIVFMKRNFNKRNYYVYLLFHLFISMPVNILKYIAKNKINNLKKYLLGTFDAIKNKTGYKELN